LVYVQNFNSPVVFLVFTKYVTMSCVGFDLLGICERDLTSPSQMPLFVIDMKENKWL